MNIFKWLDKYINKSKAYHCKPMMREHEWRSPKRDNNEKFPICIHCGKSCWWLRGYTFNSGTVLKRDEAALNLMDYDDERLRNVPWDSKLF